MLVSQRSFLFHSQSTLLSQVKTVVGLDCAGIDIDTNISIQWKASNSTWVITFDSKVTRDGAHIEPSISVGGCVYDRVYFFQSDQVAEEI